MFVKPKSKCAGIIAILPRATKKEASLIKYSFLFLFFYQNKDVDPLNPEIFRGREIRS